MQVSISRLQAALRRCWPGMAMPGFAGVAPVRLVLDSRRVAPGDVFIAVPGVTGDGRSYLAEALQSGAVQVLYHLEPGETLPDAAREQPVVGLPFLRQRLGELGRLLFEVPDALELVGVTGTNGKSSVTHYVAELSEALGRPAGLVGTLGMGRPGQLEDSGLTTPGPLTLQAALGEMAAGGIDRVAMEVSSHALEQGRLDGCHVTAAVFTNLSRDHLDYHGSMAAYAAAKARLFRRSELALAVVNADDPLARLMLAGLPEGVRVLAVGDDPAATLRVIDWRPSRDGQLALVATPEGERSLELPLMGRFNLDNVLLAIATLHGLGEPLDALFEAASRLTPVPGRMQRVGRHGRPAVIVDYAHTPEALENALVALREHLPGDGRLWCLFGCGGDRDSGKRPLMAAAAERHADRLVVTDDNPRSEDPAQIRAQILAGVSEAAAPRTESIAGRREAIARTLAQAGSDDVVLIAGKGHEPYQEIDGVRHAFSDLAEADAALARREEGA
ncbi:UDP-N-acetylmuramoyl-L-alanyl-D-glutamate--2,6-diaminopimelate ligase [Halomonas sp. MCCC 1A17488]|uniref:UDP-N-acetylmuramoyl-L-alanyl-D-glutamate--2,6-diaminopimelate ligase n=1 Tax=Billgrantia sulfidoxydans TaxID=2733484 RepID=A0ABX7W6M7_9GAMM|nr:MULTISPECIES: UDP-N-acetylmuramoyl-L-alanyl-D-glutamate--2,6-diaminopimelate ligase [Halomonas]MCE8014644.1 UDP-N-acetylmuramoyl-L-alanyl-D-glutamate--2,6-diaminopimelate ligase [Halomonas sp. MCCC 1A17488]MCG3237977.1 UDP-N-acetylmuramoyl-L-alanyl-D-glutamate--2,6-diaminopimelate ligase [Halomonas sp. MCCC 1A17488]QPP48241.1 UDP-N-acetylmuramoyl-L-alanyl-D-glutamate--2,6-diaminopimelate ligase [Halomonas sp. SS10-MC5]QTP55541.1 UDP-N-acetylmuramoyl-L-alanyl-D-glutamate--2,6-diaminopimelate 